MEAICFFILEMETILGFLKTAALERRNFILSKMSLHHQRHIFQNHYLVLGDLLLEFHRSTIQHLSTFRMALLLYMGELMSTALPQRTGRIQKSVQQFQMMET